MAQFRVDSSEVAAAAGQVRITSGNVRAEVETMMGHLVALQSSWTGAASVAFGSCAEEWRLVQANVEHNLDQISIALDTAAQTYEEAETATEGMFMAR